MTVITLGSTLQLHVSSGSCASVILRSGVTHRGGQDRVLLRRSEAADLVLLLPIPFDASIFARIEITPTCAEFVKFILYYHELVRYRRISQRHIVMTAAKRMLLSCRFYG